MNQRTLPFRRCPDHQCHRSAQGGDPPWTESEGGAADENQPRSAKALILLPLPEPLNGVTLKTIVVGLVKDQGLTWYSPKPFWWPAEFPFQNPRVAPEDYHSKPVFHII